MTPGSVIWQLRHGLQLHYRSWDQEEYVLFNNLSGDTHLVDAATMEVLSVLQAGPQTPATLGAALQLDPDPDTLAELDELLRQLQRLSLVDAVAADLASPLADPQSDAIPC